MQVMPSNWCKGFAHYLAGRYAPMLGHLYSPAGQKGPFAWWPYALDNGAFGAYLREEPFNEVAWIKLMDWAAAGAQPPIWALVPDQVGDKAGTLRLWDQYAPLARDRYGWPLAFAAQDGMTPDDVPSDADVVFIGGSTEWKRQMIIPFCNAHPRVHVGRINTYQWLRHCADAGAESCDGTGWTRGDNQQLNGLLRFFAEETDSEPIILPPTVRKPRTPKAKA